MNNKITLIRYFFCAFLFSTLLLSSFSASAQKVIFSEDFEKDIWAEGWTKGSRGYRSGFGTIAKPGTTFLVIGEDPLGAPLTFERDGRMPVLKTVSLPAHPYDVPPGTDQQRYFDRIRGTSP